MEKKKMQKLIFQKKNKSNFKSGFTIIEMMVAITIFLVVIIYGMNSLLNASLVHKKSQDMRSIMDGLTFALDDMSKNIRTGSDYYCLNSAWYIKNFFDPANLPPSSSGEKCIGIVFKEANNSSSTGNKIIAYYFNNTNNKNELRRVVILNDGTLVSNLPLTPDEVEIDIALSSFDVLGAEPPYDGNFQQPIVTINLAGKIKSKNGETPFAIQTSVSQRLIDL